jgi:hypothetical protein
VKWRYRWAAGGDSSYWTTGGGRNTWSRLVFNASDEYRELCYAAGWRAWGGPRAAAKGEARKRR